MLALRLAHLFGEHDDAGALGVRCRDDVIAEAREREVRAPARLQELVAVRFHHFPALVLGDVGPLDAAPDCRLDLVPVRFVEVAGANVDRLRFGR